MDVWLPVQTKLAEKKRYWGKRRLYEISKANADLHNCSFGAVVHCLSWKAISYPLPQNETWGAELGRRWNEEAECNFKCWSMGTWTRGWTEAQGGGQKQEFLFFPNSTEVLGWFFFVLFWFCLFAFSLNTFLTAVRMLKEEASPALSRWGDQMTSEGHPV